MIEPKVQLFDSLDLSVNIDFMQWHPLRNNFGLNGINLDVYLSFTDDAQRERFTTTVMALDCFRSLGQVNRRGLSIPVWVVEGEFSWERVFSEISEFVKTCTASTYEESVIKLQQKLYWEFDGVIFV